MRYSFENALSIVANHDSPSDDSFNINSSFENPEEAVEETLQASTVWTTLPGIGEEDIITYNIIESGTQRGKVMLVDNHDFSYTKKWEKTS